MTKRVDSQSETLNGRMAHFEFDGTPGYYFPRESTTGIVLVQEWWGVDDNMKAYGKKYSESFQVVIPDLYRSRVTQDPDEAKHYMEGMDFNSAVKDIDHMAQYLKSKGCTKVVVVGYCMGGALSIASGVKGAYIDAGVCFYGIPPKQFFDYSQLKVPMQFHFAKNDSQKGFSDKETYTMLKTTLEDASIDTSEFYEYDADHAFMNVKATAFPYEETLAKVAEERMMRFIQSQ